MEDFAWASDEKFGDALRAVRRSKGLRQLDLADRIFCDHSHISRLETGSEHPERIELEQLISALGTTTEAEAARLQGAFDRDLLERHSFTRAVVLPVDATLALIEHGAGTAREFRLAGNPRQAVAVAARAAQLARAVASGTSDDPSRKAVVGALALTLTEEVKSYLDFIRPAETGSLVAPLVTEQEAIARFLSSPRLERLAALSLEGTLYVAGHLREANGVCHDLLESVESLDDLWVPELVRAASINAGNLGDERALQTAEELTDRLIQDTDVDSAISAVFLLDGLARGQAQLGDRRAVESVERAWTHLDQARATSSYSNLRFVQLVRTHLKVLKELSIGLDQHTQQLVGEGLRACRSAGYSRYEDEIGKLLRSTGA